MLLLTIIYLAFISLGLPDAVLGSAWPTISHDFNVSLEYAGAISIVISAGTVVSSLLAARVTHYFGTGKVLSFSVLATALSLLGFAYSNYVLSMVLLAIPLGLGAGAVDAALNNFVALNYKSKHMNYLHSFWGVGATAGPFIMANYLLSEQGWRDGYFTLAVIQFALVIALFATLPLWKTPQKASNTSKVHTAPVSNRAAWNIRGVKLQLFVYFCYCSLEAGTGLWAASYLTTVNGLSASNAAFWTAMFFLGITAGRFVCGLLAENFREQILVRAGICLMIVGVCGLLFPVPSLVSQFSLVLIGLGCAPVYPNTMHLTPKRFGQHASQAIIGLSMATAYVGTTVVPPAMGIIFGSLSFSLLPTLLLLLAVSMLWASERLNRTEPATDLTYQ
ncbi:MFS transporter [Vibrio ulleungensis]|uniref:MFS transporter n=1 Tax=Vibrio ulleungensis TaxID=2807619 RepID=A0ABS2HAY4_9VIBR|nr:MFS transporter [Vibrio ulleungensis]MBM7034783.1 MFS transporter [Vibrio ulleungensis]